MTSEVSLADAPSDGISSVEFSKRSKSLLLAASWDSTVRVYDAAQNVLRASFAQPSAVLDAKFCGADNIAACGCVDGSVRILALDGAPSSPEGAVAVAPSHDAGVRCIEYSEETKVVYSGSWDKTVASWDPRQRRRVATVQVPGKVFAVAVCDAANKLVVGTAERHVLVYDARRLEGASPLQHRESSLKHQTRAIACFPDGNGYAVASIEGRVAIEFFDDADYVQARKYAFKCHRAQNLVYPVNALAFHPTLGTFATGGTDGYVNIWDGYNKKRLCQLQKYPTSVAALAFNLDGSLLAIAASYCYEEGEKDHPKDEIIIHPTFPYEVTPKNAHQPPPPPPPPPPAA